MYPVLFQIGNFPVQTVGVIHASAVAVGAWWFLREAVKSKVDPSRLYNLLLVVVLWAVIGARLFSVLFDGYLPIYLRHPFLVFALWDGGFVFYGGLIFGLAAGIWYMRKHGLNGWQLSDWAAPALALGLAIGRLGCLASGDSYGKPTNLPWAITFTNPRADAPLGIPLHPTQIYSAITNLGIFGILLLLSKKKKFEGEMFLLFVIFYAATRSFIEIFRDDPRGVYFGGLISTSQIISIFVAATALVFLLTRFRRSSANALAVALYQIDGTAGKGSGKTDKSHVKRKRN